MGVSKFSPASQRGVDATPTANSTNLVESGGVKSALNTVDESIAIRVSGNKTTYAGGAAIGQYVIVSDSTITGITDGMYKAAKAIPYNTAIDSTYLTAVSGGGMNDLKAAFDETRGRSFSSASGGDAIIDAFIASNPPAERIIPVQIYITGWDYIYGWGCYYTSSVCWVWGANKGGYTIWVNRVNGTTTKKEKSLFA